MRVKALRDYISDLQDDDELAIWFFRRRDWNYEQEAQKEVSDEVWGHAVEVFEKANDYAGGLMYDTLVEAVEVATYLYNKETL